MLRRDSNLLRLHDLVHIINYSVLDKRDAGVADLGVWKLRVNVRRLKEKLPESS